MAKLTLNHLVQKIVQLHERVHQILVQKGVDRRWPHFQEGNHHTHMNPSHKKALPLK